MVVLTANEDEEGKMRVLLLLLVIISLVFLSVVASFMYSKSKTLIQHCSLESKRRAQMQRWRKWMMI